MEIIKVTDDEFRINYKTEDGAISISAGSGGIIFDFFESDDDQNPFSMGFTIEELAEFLKEYGVK